MFLAHHSMKEVSSNFLPFPKSSLSQKDSASRVFFETKEPQFLSSNNSNEVTFEYVYNTYTSIHPGQTCFCVYTISVSYGHHKIPTFLPLSVPSR